DRRPDVDERQPHAAAFAGASDGRIGRAHGLAEPQFVSELFADGSGAFTLAGYATGAGDFADRPRRGYFAATWRIAGRTILGTARAVVAADRAAERCGGEIFVVVAGVYLAGYDFAGSRKPGRKVEARGIGCAAALGLDASDA